MEAPTLGGGFTPTLKSSGGAAGQVPLSISGSTTLGTENAEFYASGPAAAEDEYGNIYVVWQEYSGTYYEVWVNAYCQQALGTYCSGKTAGAWGTAYQVDSTSYTTYEDGLPVIAASQSGVLCVAWGSANHDYVFFDCFVSGAWTGVYDFGTHGDELGPTIDFDEGGYLVMSFAEQSSTSSVCIAQITVATTPSGSCVNYSLATLGLDGEWAVDDLSLSCLLTAATTCTLVYGGATSSSDVDWGLYFVHSTNDFATSITNGPSLITDQGWSTSYTGGGFGGSPSVNVEPGEVACSTSSANCAIAYDWDSGDASTVAYVVDYAYSTDGFASTGNLHIGTPPTSTANAWNLPSVTIIGTSSPVIAWDTSTDVEISGSADQAPSAAEWGTTWSIACSGTYMCYPAVAHVPTSGDVNLGNNIPWRVDVAYPSASDQYYAFFYGPALTAPSASLTTLDVDQSTTISTAIYQGPPIAEGFTIPATGYTWSSLPTGCSSTASSFVCTPTGSGTFSVTVYATDTGLFTSSTVGPVTITVNSALVAGTVTPASASIDSGQSITLTSTSPTGGTPAYSYLWRSGGSATCSSDTSSGVTTTSYLVSPGSSTYYCVQYGDSSSGSPAAVAYSNVVLITVNSDLEAGSVSPASATIDSGQSIALTSTTASGGTPAYSYLWRSGGSATCSSDTSTGVTALSYSPSPGSSTYYCVQYGDSSSGTPAQVVYSNVVLVTVDSALTAGSVTPGSATIDNGQTLTLTSSSPSGGTPAYSYLWRSGGSATCSSDTSTGVATTTYSPSPTSNTYYCVQYGDSSTGTPAATVYSNVILVTVNSALGAGSVTPAAPSIDSGQSITLTSSSPTGGTPAYSYAWRSGSSSTCTSDALAGVSTTTDTVSPASNTYYCVQYGDSSTGTPAATVYSNVVLVTVNGALEAGSVTPASATIDDGQSITLTSTSPSGGTPSYTYLWRSGSSGTCSSDASTGVTATSYTPSPSSTTDYCVQYGDSSAGTPAQVVYSNVVMVTVNSALVAGAITPSAPGIDSGQSITLTANPSGGTPSYSVYWYTGASCNSLIGGPANTLLASPSSTTTFSYEVTDSATSPESKCSAGDVVTVNPDLSAGAITPASPVVDLGQSVTLTSNPSGGTAPLSYQWYTGSGCTSPISSATSPTYGASPGSTTTYYYEVVDSSAAGAQSACSAGDTVTVNPALVAGAITPASPVLDDGQSVTLTANPSGGTPAYSYQWYDAASCSGSIAGATSQTYDAGPSSTTTYSYKVTDSSTQPASVCSAGDTVTVNSALTASPITPASPGIDPGQSITLTANPSGGTTPYTYQWYTGAACTSAIAGATSSTYGASPGSTTTYYYEVTDHATSPATACSAGDTVTVNGELVAGAVTPASPVLDDGQSVTLTANPSGGTSPYNYQWYTGASCTSSIAGASSKTYDASPSTTTSYYYQVTDSSAAGPVSACSAADTVTVNPTLVAGAITPSAPVLDDGQSVTLTANPSGGTPAYSYQWYTGATCTSPISSATSSTYLASPASTTAYYYEVTDHATTPSTACSAGDTVTVNPSLTAGAITPAAPTIDTGQSITLDANPSGGTPSYSYQWFTGASCNNVVNGATGSTYAPSPLVATTYSYQVTDHATTPSSVCSSGDTVSVNPALTAGAITPSAPVLDDGQTVTLTANPSGGTPAYSYQWYTGASCSTSIAGATSSTYGASPATTTSYSYEVTDHANSPEAVCSATDSVTVDPALAAGAITPAAPVLDDGQSTTLTANPSGGTPAYGYQWYTGASCSSAIGGATASTYAASPGSTTTYSYQVTDHASTPESVCSAGDTVTVNAELVAGAITPNSPAMDVGQSVTLTANPSGGTPAYSYQWYTGATCSSAIGGATAATYSASPGSTTVYSYQVTDHATTPTSQCSGGDTVTVNPLPTASPSANPNPAGEGSPVVFTGTTTGGTGPNQYAWRFGDGSVFASGYQDPTHTFNTTGTFVVWFWVNDSVGKTASGSVSVTVSTVAATGLSSTNPTDVGVAVSFTGSATGGSGGYTYTWRYDDGSVASSHDQDPTHTFNTSGTFDVRLWVNDSSLDDSQAVIAQVVNADPTVAASATPNPTDVAYPTVLNGVGTGGTSASYLWQCSNGFKDAVGSPTTTFGSVGTVVCWVWYNDTWFSSSSHVSVTVSTAPTIVSMTGTPDPTDVGVSVALAVAGAGGSGSTTYAWRCTDGFTASVASTSHAFAAAGSPKCEAWYNDSVTSATQSLTLTINADPSVSASASPNPTDVGVTVQLTAGGSGGTGTPAYAWRCPGGFTSTLQDPTVATLPVGTPVCTVWYNDSFLPSSAQVAITVNDAPSVTASASPSPSEVGVAVSLTATGSGGTSASYTWQCTDSFHSVAQDPTHTFAVSGSESCRVWFNDTWLTSTFLVPITVAADPSYAASASRLVMDAGQSLPITGTPSAGTPPYSCQWYVNGSAVSGAAGTNCASFSFVPSGPGASWTVYATLSDSFAKTATTNTLTIDVGPALLVGASSGRSVGDLGQPFPFTGAVSGGSSPYTCQWYANGAAVAGATSCSSLTYTPLATGLIPVYLHALDTAWGQTNSSTLMITVNPDPTVAITLTTPGVDVGQTVNVTGSVAGGTSPFTCRWYVNGSLVSGNNCAGTDYLTTHPGPLVINATVIDAAGWASPSTTVTVQVQPLPSVKLSPASSTADAGQAVTFVATISGGTAAFSCQWFENSTLLSGATSCGSYVFTPAHPGTYEIWIRTTDSASPPVPATGYANVTVGPALRVSISPTTATIDVGYAQALSSTVGGGLAAYTYTWWVSGVQVVGSGSSYSFVPASSGSFTVQVQVTDANGDTVAASSTITVNALPTVALNRTGIVETAVGASFGLSSSILYGTAPYGPVEWYVNGVAAGSGATFVLTESTTGSYAVNASVYDADGMHGTSPVVTDLVVRISVKWTGATEGEVGLGTTYTAAGAGGTAPYTYQWLLNGAPISGASGASFLWTPSATGTENLSVRATDADGLSALWGAMVTIVGPVAATLTLSSPTIDDGMSTTLTPGASGGVGPYTYSWKLNGVAWTAPGSAGAPFDFTPSAAGLFTITVEALDSLGGTNTSQTAMLTVNALPTVALSVNDTTPNAGSAILLSASVSGGTPGYTYSWTLNASTALSGSGATLSFTPAGGGTYVFQVTVTDQFGKSAPSNIMTVTVGPNPAFATHTSTTSGFPLWLLLVVVGVAVAALLLILVMRRRKKQPEAGAAASEFASGGEVAASAGTGAAAAVGLSTLAGTDAVAPTPTADSALGATLEAPVPEAPTVQEVPRVPPSYADSYAPAEAAEPEPEVAGGGGAAATTSPLEETTVPLPAPVPADKGAPAPPSPETPPAPPAAKAAAPLSYISIAPVHPATQARGLSGGEVDISGFARCPRCGSPLPSAKSECLVCAAADLDPAASVQVLPDVHENATAPSKRPAAPAPEEHPSTFTVLPDKRARPESAPRIVATSPPPAPKSVPLAAPPAAPSAPSPPRAPAAPAEPVAPAPAPARAPPPPTAPVVAAVAPPAADHPKTCYICGSRLDASAVCPTCGIDWADRTN